MKHIDEGRGGGGGEMREEKGGGKGRERKGGGEGREGKEKRRGGEGRFIVFFFSDTSRGKISE